MEVETLFTFNFKILYQSNAKIRFLPLVFLILECQTPWYRQLPLSKLETRQDLIGIWQKKTNPRSPINSSWYKNTWSEKIILQSGNKFIKIYESEDWIANDSIYRKVEGFGTYSSMNNWILLETKTLRITRKEGEELVKNESKSFESSLLYYYYRDENLIIPMIYDVGYEEKDFGVKDGINQPYDDKSSNFFTFLKIYAFKEFQSHAYYLEK